jgi:hypothetical protein
MKRQYHTSTGVVEMEPTQAELDMEFEMKMAGPDFQMYMKSLAELTGKTEKEVKDTLKKNYKG